MYWKMGREGRLSARPAALRLTRERGESPPLPLAFSLCYTSARFLGSAVSSAQLIPYASVNGRTIGHVSTLTRFLCRVGSRTAAAVAAVVPSSDGPPVLPKSKDAVAPLPTELAMGGRFLYDEVNRTLLLRTALGGNPIWMAWAFGSDGEPSSSTASNSGINGTSAGSTDDVEADSAAGAAAAVASSAAALGIASAGRVRSVTMYFPGQELTTEGVATHIMMAEDALTPRAWAPSDNTPAGDTCNGGDVEMGFDQRGPHSGAAGGGTDCRWSRLVRPSRNGAGDCSSAARSDSSTASSASCTGSTASNDSAWSDGTVMSASRGGGGSSDDPHLAHPQRRSGGGRGGATAVTTGRRRPRTSVVDFQGFAASLAANVNGVYRHALPVGAFPGDSSTYFGSEGVVPASSVLPIFGHSPGGRLAAAHTDRWGVDGGGGISLEGLETAFATLAMATTPLVRDADRLLTAPPRAPEEAGRAEGTTAGANGHPQSAAAGSVGGTRSMTAVGVAFGDPAAALSTVPREPAFAAAGSTAGDCDSTAPSAAAIQGYASLFGDDTSAAAAPSAAAIGAFASLF